MALVFWKLFGIFKQKPKEMSPEKKKEYMKKYYQEHKEYFAEHNRNWYENHKEEKLEYNKEFKETHKEDIKKWAKTSYERNKDKHTERKKVYAEKNKEHIKEKQREWAQTKSGKACSRLHKYKLMDLKYCGGGTTITKQWILDNIFNGQKCHYCGESDWKKLGCDRIDNSKPHTPDNVVCACGDCNHDRRNRNKSVEEYVIYRRSI